MSNMKLLAYDIAMLCSMYAIQLVAVNQSSQNWQIRLFIATSDTMSCKDAFFKQDKGRNNISYVNLRR